MSTITLKVALPINRPKNLGVILFGFKSIRNGLIKTDQSSLYLIFSYLVFSPYSR